MRPLHHHEEGRAMAKKKAKKTARKTAKKRSTSASRKKTGAKNVKARSLKAKPAARGRSGATPARPATPSYNAPDVVSSSDPGLTSFNNP
jgi:hypothetical protein